MNSKTIAMAFMAALLVGSMASVYAYRGDPNVPGPYCQIDEEVRSQIQDALSQGDYAAWISLREEYNLPMHGKLMQIANEENFALISQLHKAVMEGDETAVQQIRKELGLGTGSSMKYRHGNNMRGFGF